MTAALSAALTPTQDLLGELLAARHRLGHEVWTLTANGSTKRALLALEHRGLVGWKHGVVERTYLAWLTEVGKGEWMTPDYVPPILGGLNGLKLPDPHAPVHLTLDSALALLRAAGYGNPTEGTSA